MKQYVIWKGIASVEIPDSFQAATIGEKRKIFGNYRKLPDFVLLDRQHRIRISCVDTDRIENLKKMDIEQIAQFMSHIYKRTVPGQMPISRLLSSRQARSMPWKATGCLPSDISKSRFLQLS